MKFVLCIWLSSLFFLAAAHGATPTVKVGVLKYGTLNWEMDVIRQLNLEQQHGIKLEAVPLSSSQALQVALQGGAVDMIIGDWLWVARQTEMDRHFYFYPYSSAAGVLVTHPDANIRSLADLKGKTIGIAGGKANKNWVLYHSYIEQQTGLDISKDATAKFAAPPVLNALITQGKLDAVINFWHYGALLNAEGMPTLLSMHDVLKGMGVEKNVPLLGWLFRQDWADKNAELVERFLALSFAARQKMQRDDTLWATLPSFTQKYDKKAQPYLIKAYRAGIPAQFNAKDVTQLKRLFAVLKQHETKRALTGDLAALPPAIFWSSHVLP